VCFRFYWENCVITWTLNDPSVYSGLILNVMDMAEYAQMLRVIEENSQRMLRRNQVSELD
jgi:hypothetical protein